MADRNEELIKEEGDNTKWVLCDYNNPLAKGTRKKMEEEKRKCEEEEKKNYSKLFVTVWGEYKRLVIGSLHVPSRETTFAQLKVHERM